MSRVVLRYATAADIARMTDEPLPCRIRAFAAELDGELLGIGGLAYLPTGVVGAWLQMHEGSRRYAVALHRAGLRVLDEARRLGIRRLVAMAEPGVEPAERWLRRLGFEETIVDGKQVFVWQIPSPGQL